MASCICFETGIDTTWEIDNHTGDTITIYFTNPYNTLQYHENDTVRLEPMDYVVFTDSDIGRESNHHCTEPFSDEHIQYEVSGNKTLLKKLHIPGNWQHESGKKSRCGYEEKCTFIIEQTDIAE